MVFAGGEGSLLLMQADSMDAETSKLASTFIIASLESFDESLDSSSWWPFSAPVGRLRQRQIAHAAVAARPTAVFARPTGGARGRPAPPYTVLSARRYWIYGGLAGA